MSFAVRVKSGSQTHLRPQLTNQRQLIVRQFGFTTIQTTLIGCVDGVVLILAIWLGVTLATVPAIGRGHAGVLMFIPALLGCLLVNLLPSHMKVGLLFGYWLSSTSSPSWRLDRVKTHPFIFSLRNRTLRHLPGLGFDTHIRAHQT